IVANLAGPKIRLSVGGPIDGFEPYEDAVAAYPATPVDDEIEGAWMFYSSGTTGRPKGIRPPELGGPLGAPMPLTGMVRHLFGADEATRYLSPAPLYHAAPSGGAAIMHHGRAGPVQDGRPAGRRCVVQRGGAQVTGRLIGAEQVPDHPGEGETSAQRPAAVGLPDPLR